MPSRKNEGSPTEAWTRDQIAAFLSGRTTVEQFWEPIPRILEQFVPETVDPGDRVTYFWSQISVEVHAVVRLNYAQDDLRTYLEKWLRAFELTEKEWQQLVHRKGRPLEENVDDWDS